MMTTLLILWALLVEVSFTMAVIMLFMSACKCIKRLRGSFS